MYLYKVIEEDGSLSLEELPCKVNADNFTEISEQEYRELMKEICDAAAANAAQEELSKDERIAELEAENAALLYRVLTGEELTDV